MGEGSARAPQRFEVALHAGPQRARRDERRQSVEALHGQPAARYGLVREDVQGTAVARVVAAEFLGHPGEGALAKEADVLAVFLAEVPPVRGGRRRLADQVGGQEHHRRLREQ